MIIFHLLKLVLLYCPRIWSTTHISANQPRNMAQKNELGTAWRTHEKWETYKRFRLDKLTRWGNVYDVGTEGRIFFFFFFLRRYNFREVLAFSTSFFHLLQFLMQSFRFVILILVISLFTSSSHLFLDLPSDLVSAGDHRYTFFTMLLSGIHCTCPNQANLCALM